MLRLTHKFPQQFHLVVLVIVIGIAYAIEACGSVWFFDAVGNHVETVKRTKQALGEANLQFDWLDYRLAILGGCYPVELTVLV